ncbi:MBL fold hydrolase [candidate division WOR-1 bacterium RIFCSPLOWO2_02_FULL_46_20]|uniref:MBL fold hydrolase n=1 Tax=candidate division WOR-1 bacterium RIFCSPLOWO2_02_FULL_46_20 TaxID=1802567 RepID=A0A1F4RC70_UNCSA|nr:MAG: MBL fold hydrolase [candidate division WOR-1 bacterium RIFCSPHIGHO2_02_FULL_45_12]OGC05760.1 MAG: MBL fold hydrolase [candidate division WOR-1 bacterium RIFCSPLOWO2_02_FULL_46_20]
MSIRIIKENIYAVGVIDWDRRLFDELIPLPDGTTYNAYLIKGSDKVALLDTVDPPFGQELLENLQELKVDRIDYIISHHGEQDHSGAIPRLLAGYPMAKVVVNQKNKELLKNHLLVADGKFLVVADRETLSLGDKTLEFIFAPWVHWPETIFSYLKEDNILFTCDFLGSHLATSDLYAKEGPKVYAAAKRYYAEVMMPFRPLVTKHLEIVKQLNPGIVATSHGPIYDKPKYILEAYADWVGEAVGNKVVIPYVSMHGSTKVMVDYFVEKLMAQGVKVKPFNLTAMDLGDLAMELVDAATVVLGTPTVLAGPHPSAVYAAYLLNALRPKTKFVSLIGSFGWGGKTVEQIAGMLTALKVEILAPVMVKGLPKEEDFRRLDRLVDDILKKHQGVL